MPGERMTSLTPQYALQQTSWPARVILKLLVVIAVATIVGLLAWPAIRGDQKLIDVLGQAALPGFLLALVLLVAVRHERRWAQSVTAMSRLLTEIRRGEAADEAACDELLAAGGGAAEMAELAERISTLCRDLKAQQQAVRELEAEIQRRVATRTDTLERKMGVLRERASRDALTGLGNRGSFDAVFPAMVERARRETAELCVVMIDVDDFKPLNDTCGHTVGDEHLRKLGQLIRGAVREHDEAFRYGGDEFVLVLWNTPARAGRRTAERIGSLADGLADEYDVPNPPRLCCGVANLGEDPQVDAAELLRRADEDLYRLKHARKARRSA